MVKVFALRFEEDKEDILLDKMSLLAYEDRNRIERYKQTKDRLMSFLGISLVYAFCDDFADVPELLTVVEGYDFLSNKDIFDKYSVKIDEAGKPYFENKNDVFFNVSHSGEWCFAALSDKPVGIDVQKIKELKSNVAKRFFDAGEIAYIEADEEKSIERTIEVWCIKESYVKMIGEGLGYGLDSFYADFSEGSIFDKKEQRITADYRCQKFSDDYIWSFCIPRDKA